MDVNRYDIDEKNTEFNINNFKRALKYVKAHRFKMFFVLLVSIIRTICSLIFVKLVQTVLDDILPKNSMKDLITIALIGVGLCLFIAIFDFIKNKLLNIINLDIIEKIKEDLFIHLQELSFDFYNTRPHGKILIRLTDYAETVSGFITHRLIDTFLSIINLIFVIVFMFNTNSTLSLITLSGVFILITIFSIRASKKRKMKIVVNNKKSNLNAYLFESIKGITTTQSFNREKKNTEVVASLNEEYNQNIDKYLWYAHFEWTFNDLIAYFVEVSLYVVGIFFIPGITVGLLIAMTSYSNRFYRPIRQIFRTMDRFLETTTYLERILELIDEPIDITDTVDAVDVEMKGHIHFQNVTFGYSEDKTILDNVTFEIQPGESVAIVGETGSGKTTITNLIARFYDISKGIIEIDNVDIRRIKLSSLRSQISVMLQDNFLFTMSIMDNLKYGNEKISDKEVKDIAKKMHIHDFIMSQPDGYDTILKNGAKELSQGQRQLLCYVRTVIADPKILILDEATSKIDVKTEKIIREDLNILLENRTSILIAHRLSTIIACDKIMFVKDKKVVEMGSHEELMKEKGEYYNLYMNQVIDID